MSTVLRAAVPIALALAWAACQSSSPGGGNGGQTTTSTASGGSPPAPLAACGAPADAPSKGASYTIPVHTPPASCQASADGGAPDDGGTSDAGAFSCSTAIPTPTACDMCVETSCCAQLAACNAVPSCLDCLTDPNADPDTCAPAAIQTALAAVLACQASCCEDSCYPPCNPVTNAGCNAADMEACDVDPQHGGYTCFRTAMPVSVCQTCDENAGPFCGAHLTCLSDGHCGAYCCDDGDCGDAGTCDKTRLPKETVLGVCVHR